MNKKSLPKVVEVEHEEGLADVRRMKTVIDNRDAEM
jgi:hypothetical protein